MEFPYEIKKLFLTFPHGYIGGDCEFYAIKGWDISFPLERTRNESDIRAFLFRNFSYFCTEDFKPYLIDFFDLRAKSFRKDLLAQINSYCHTNFTKNDIERIFTAIGYGKRDDVLNKFINGGCKLGTIRACLPVDYLTPEEQRKRNKQLSKAKKAEKRAERRFIRELRDIEYQR